MSFNKFIRKIANIPITPRINKGGCYVCKQPVFVSEGQLYKTYRKQPTHKKCRKAIE